MSSLNKFKYDVYFRTMLEHPFSTPSKKEIGAKAISTLIVNNRTLKKLGHKVLKTFL